MSVHKDNYFAYNNIFSLNDVSSILNIPKFLSRASLRILSRDIPKTKGKIKISGLNLQVKIYRDNRGIPHIQSENINDLYEAQGFVTAQDRLWQMDIMRRTVGGNLSEVFGKNQIYKDKLFRTLQIQNSAKQGLHILSQKTLGYLKAYASGVNAFIEQAKNKKKLPYEFSVLGYQPEKWSIVDSLSVFKLLAYEMSENWCGELYRYQLQKKVGLDFSKEMFPIYPDDGYISMRYSGKKVKKVLLNNRYLKNGTVDLRSLLSLINERPDETIGSNAWVVSGKLTKSGKPMLANDPHISHTCPALWYQSHLILNDKYDKLNVFGVTLPGVPGIILGHNEKIAWGVTNTKIDTQDLYIEKRNPKNQYQFEYEGSFENAHVQREVIHVKGASDITFEVLITRHGPVISEVMNYNEKNKNEVIALNWTGYPPSREMESIFLINRASNWGEFRAALLPFNAPVLNIVFASNDGTIASRVCGSVPLREKNDGLLPVPGWKGKYEAKGLIPFEEMPEIVNPETGFIVTSNNKIIDDDFPYRLSFSWAPPYRATRIVEMIKNKKMLTIDDMINIQTDFTNLQARLLIPILVPLLKENSLNSVEKKALYILKSWNQIDSAKQAGPLIFHIWWKNICDKLFETRMGTFLYSKMVDKVNVVDQMLVNASKGKERMWINSAGGLKKLVFESFRSTIDECKKMQGNSPQKWKWGKFHKIGPVHLIGQHSKFLKCIISTTVRSVGGSNVSVGAMAYEAKSGNVFWSASWRQVVDFSNIRINSKDILSPGQSGHFLSKWYEDQACFHTKGMLKKQLFEKEDYEKGEKLILFS